MHLKWLTIPHSTKLTHSYWELNHRHTCPSVDLNYQFLSQARQYQYIVKINITPNKFWFCKNSNKHFNYQAIYCGIQYKSYLCYMSWHLCHWPIYIWNLFSLHRFNVNCIWPIAFQSANKTRLEECEIKWKFEKVRIKTWSRKCPALFANESDQTSFWSIIDIYK